jgi:hypothetical protein
MPAPPRTFQTRKNCLPAGAGVKPGPATVFAALTEPGLGLLPDTSLEPKPTISAKFTQDRKSGAIFLSGKTQSAVR